MNHEQAAKKLWESLSYTDRLKICMEFGAPRSIAERYAKAKWSDLGRTMKHRITYG